MGGGRVWMGETRDEGDGGGESGVVCVVLINMMELIKDGEDGGEVDE